MHELPSSRLSQPIELFNLKQLAFHSKNWIEPYFNKFTHFKYVDKFNDVYRQRFYLELSNCKQQINQQFSNISREVPESSGMRGENIDMSHMYIDVKPYVDMLFNHHSISMFMSSTPTTPIIERSNYKSLAQQINFEVLIGMMVFKKLAEHEFSGTMFQTSYMVGPVGTVYHMEYKTTEPLIEQEVSRIESLFFGTEQDAPKVTTMTIDVVQKAIQASSRLAKARYTIELAQALKFSHNYHENLLADILSQEIVAEIVADVLNRFNVVDIDCTNLTTMDIYHAIKVQMNQHMHRTCCHVNFELITNNGIAALDQKNFKLCMNEVLFLRDGVYVYVNQPDANLMNMPLYVSMYTTKLTKVVDPDNFQPLMKVGLRYAAGEACHPYPCFRLVNYTPNQQLLNESTTQH